MSGEGEAKDAASSKETPLELTSSDKIEIYAILRSGIRDLQDERAAQSARFQTIAIAIGTGYGALMVLGDFDERRIVFSIGLLTLNAGAAILGYFWRAQMVLLQLAIKARYVALHKVGEVFQFPVNPYQLDLKVRNNLWQENKEALRMYPRDTVSLQSKIPIAYYFSIVAMTGLSGFQLAAVWVG